MDPDGILRHLQETFSGLDVLSTPDTHYVFYDPRRDVPQDRRQPFTTLVLADAHDTASNLSRPGVFRLNVGVTRVTYRALFGPEPPWGPSGGPVETGHDFTLLDTILPHPVYAPLSWICVLNPDATWPRAKAYLQEAYDAARRRHERRG